MDRIIYKGYKQPLVQDDVPINPDHINVSKVFTYSYQLKASNNAVKYFMHTYLNFFEFHNSK